METVPDSTPPVCRGNDGLPFDVVRLTISSQPGVPDQSKDTGTR